MWWLKVSVAHNPYIMDVLAVCQPEQIWYPMKKVHSTAKLCHISRIERRGHTFPGIFSMSMSVGTTIYCRLAEH
jgi:NADH:ubiquinone oxidoreductase subunit E